MHEQYGWHYINHRFEDNFVDWGQETPQSTDTALQTMGFAATPSLTGGRSFGVIVYKRDPQAKGFRLQDSSNQPTIYALLLRVNNEYLDRPIFVSSLPSLLQLLTDIEPAHRMLDR